MGRVPYGVQAVQAATRAGTFVIKIKILPFTRGLFYLFAQARLKWRITRNNMPVRRTANRLRTANVLNVGAEAKIQNVQSKPLVNSIGRFPIHNRSPSQPPTPYAPTPSALASMLNQCLSSRVAALLLLIAAAPGVQGTLVGAGAFCAWGCRRTWNPHTSKTPPRAADPGPA